jgi:hypothetical protein
MENTAWWAWALEFVELIGLWVFVVFKFLFAPSTLYLLDYGFWNTIFYSITGGWLGVVVFYYGGKAIFRWIDRKWPPKKQRKKFTELNKMIVRFKRRYGLNGIAFMLGLGSIPIISLVAAKYYQSEEKTIYYMLVSVVVWSFILTGGTAAIVALF